MTADDTNHAANSSRWQFSLRTLLLVVVIFCIAIPMAIQTIKLYRAEAELRQLRNEVGYLSVDDRNKVHVIAVDMNEPDTWRWRIFLPQGIRYSLCLGYGDIPPNGVPEPKLKHISNEPYSDEDVEVLVTAKLRLLDDGNWSLSVSSAIGDRPHQMGGGKLTIPGKQMRDFKKVGIYDAHTLGARGAKLLDPRGPIVLLQQRTRERRPDGTYQSSVGPMPGYMIWLEKE